MVKKKRSIHETATTVIVDDVTSSEEDQVFTDLSKNLAEIRKAEGVIGYILRSTTAATIDLKEPEKIAEYAILSSQVVDSSQEISALFELGNAESITLLGHRRKQNQHIPRKGRRLRWHFKENFILTKLTIPHVFVF
jgi:F420-0:gamma-glutamyl ligase-like protein